MTVPMAGSPSIVAGPARRPGASGDATAAVLIRPVRASDASDLERFYAELSPQSRRSRFLGSVEGLSHRQASVFCTPDHDHREGFVAVLARPDPEEGRVVGHLCLEPDRDGTAEVALAIADEWQRRGLGRRLMNAALDWARGVGVSKFSATMFAANPGIHRLLLGLGLPSRVRPLAAGVSEMTIDLSAAAPEAA